MEQQKALDEVLSSIDTKDFIKAMEKKDKLPARLPFKKKKSFLSIRNGKKKVTSPITSPRLEERISTGHIVTLTKFLLYNLDICTAIIECYVCTPDQMEVAQSILSLFSANRVEQQLITHCLKLEIEKNRDKATLFRGSSSGAILLSHYCRMKALESIQELLDPFYETLGQIDQAIEIDPNRISAEGALLNITTLKDLIETLLHRVYTYDEKFPSAVMSVFKKLHLQVILKYPETQAEIIGGFFFLRFFCPILLSPSLVGICKKISPAAKRTVVLVTKVIQNISNCRPFSKEGYMIPFNSLIEEQIPKMTEFLLRLANPPEGRSFFIPKACTDDNELIPPISNDTVLFLCEKIATNGSAISDFLDDQDSVNAFEGFYNSVIFSIHENHDLGWVPLVKKLERPKELGSVSREAFTVVRDALHLCEDELKELRVKLEEERELRTSMQHIIINMSDSIHFQVDERVKYRVDTIMKKMKQPSADRERFRTILFAKPPIPFGVKPPDCTLIPPPSEEKPLPPTPVRKKVQRPIPPRRNSPVKQSN